MALQNCKLTYFNLPGRGEAARIALSIGNIKFVDERVQFSQWKEMKSSTPWDSLPILTLSDGTVIAQQRAILRLIGKETGLYPNDAIAAAKVDELMDAVEEVTAAVKLAGKGLPQDKMEEARRVVCAEGGAVFEILKNVDDTLAAKSGCYAVGDTLTIVDFLIFCIVNTLVSGHCDGVPADAHAGFDNIGALCRAVRSCPAVCKWYDSLDDSIFVPECFLKTIS